MNVIGKAFAKMVIFWFYLMKMQLNATKEIQLFPGLVYARFVTV